MDAVECCRPTDGTMELTDGTIERRNHDSRMPSMLCSPLKTRIDTVCQITECGVAGHKLLPDLSHTHTVHTQTYTHTDSLFTVQLGSSKLGAFIMWALFWVGTWRMIYEGISTSLYLTLHHKQMHQTIFYLLCAILTWVFQLRRGGWVWWVWEGRGLYTKFQPDKPLKVIVHTSHWDDWSKPHCLNCPSVAFEDTPGTKQKHIRQCWLLAACFLGGFADCCPPIPSSTLSSNTHVKIARPPHWHIPSSMVSICGLFNWMGHLLKST